MEYKIREMCRRESQKGDDGAVGDQKKWLAATGYRKENAEIKCKCWRGSYGINGRANK